MKKNILLLLCCTMCVAAFSQKIVKNEKDAFTGNQVTETSYVTISDGFTCAIRTVNKTSVLLAAFNCGKEVYSMAEGAGFMLKLQNDSVITLYNSNDAVAEYWSTVVSGIHISHFTLKTKYLISDEQIKELQSNMITTVRFHTKDGYIERNVSGKHAKKLLKLFNLIK